MTRLRAQHRPGPEHCPADLSLCHHPSLLRAANTHFVLSAWLSEEPRQGLRQHHVTGEGRVRPHRPSPSRRSLPGLLQPHLPLHFGLPKSCASGKTQLPGHHRRGASTASSHRREASGCLQAPLLAIPSNTGSLDANHIDCYNHLFRSQNIIFSPHPLANMFSKQICEMGK